MAITKQRLVALLLVALFNALDGSRHPSRYCPKCRWAPKKLEADPPANDDTPVFDDDATSEEGDDGDDGDADSSDNSAEPTPTSADNTTADPHTDMPTTPAPPKCMGQRVNYTMCSNDCFSQMDAECADHLPEILAAEMTLYCGTIQLMHMNTGVYVCGVTRPEQPGCMAADLIMKVNSTIVPVIKIPGPVLFAGYETPDGMDFTEATVSCEYPGEIIMASITGGALYLESLSLSVNSMEGGGMRMLASCSYDRYMSHTQMYISIGDESYPDTVVVRTDTTKSMTLELWGVPNPEWSGKQLLCLVYRGDQTVTKAVQLPHIPKHRDGSFVAYMVFTYLLLVMVLYLLFVLWRVVSHYKITANQVMKLVVCCLCTRAHEYAAPANN